MLCDDRYGDGDSDHDPNESDLLPEPDIDPRYDPLLRYDRMDPPRTVNHNPPYTNAVQQMVQARQGRPSEGAGGVGGGHRPASAAAHASSGGGGRPSWQGGLRDTSPTGRSTLSAQVRYVHFMVNALACICNRVGMCMCAVGACMFASLKISLMSYECMA